MKKLTKAILMAIPALAVALAVGMTTIGCGDDTTTSPDLSMTNMVGPDMSHTAVVHDMVNPTGG
jgi:hypothetical protein